MRHSKLLILAAALLIMLELSGAALAEDTINNLWKSGNDFLFHTDNVTVNGDAIFTLDGKLFKTAQLNYLQDGYCSYYGLKLITPKKDGTDREGGWTIIADGDENIAIMDAYYPGTYRSGLSTPHNTLLRHSVQLDALTELGGTLAKQLDNILPADTITVTESESVKNIHIKLSGDQIPEMAVSMLNVAAGFLSDRWFSNSHDRVLGDDYLAFDSYITVTEALTDGTVKWTLQAADIEFAMDTQGRLSAVSGTVNVDSTYWDGVVRSVELQFHLTMTDYGTSHVKPFDPADYHVVPQYEVYGE